MRAIEARANGVGPSGLDLPSGAARRGTRATARRLLLIAAALSLGVLLATVVRSIQVRPASSAHKPGSATSPASGLLGLPAAARGPVSAAVGSADPAYLVRPAAGGL